MLQKPAENQRAEGFRSGLTIDRDGSLATGGRGVGLPPFLEPLFWDVDPTGLDAQIHRDFVIGRILSAGTLESIRWARSHYGDDALREWIVRHEGRQLSGPQFRFWETVIGLPAVSVNAWLATAERRLREGRSAS